MIRKAVENMGIAFTYFILFLHPFYKLNFFTSDPKLSHIYLNKWVQYYFVRWFGNKPNSMIWELLAYKKNKFPFNKSSL